jgi:sialate O-acetylesterase
MKRILLLFIALAAAWGAAAKIRLPEIIGNDMVLQQNAEVRLWGWAEPHAAVKVETSWGAGAAVKSDADGRWAVSVRTPAGSYEPQRITFASGDRVTFDRVLIGEVWFAGGQSNMEMPLGGFWQCPVTDANEIIARAGAKSGKLHYVKIPHAAAYTPQDRTAGSWTPCTTATAAKFTAAGYFFAEMLNDVLGVPVGIIDCSWGGSRVESWMSREVLSGYSDIDLTEEGISRVAQHLRPMVMYNAMLRPVAGYTVRGFLWYQGESNVGRYMDYAARLADMVSLWRGLWGRDDLPFYYVEIAPFEYGNGKSPYLREAQCRAQELISNSGMICTNDLVEPYEFCNVHPKNKRDVGYRLAFMALNKTYGMKEIACQSPQYESMEIRDGKARIRFKYMDQGFNRGFEICGADKVFYPADAVVENQFALVVSSEKVPEPVAVRYCFRDFQPGNLADTRELPVVPFRTDDF